MGGNDRDWMWRMKYGKEREFEGILGSGFALKVQHKQRQKHFSRQIPAAATLIQCAWRLYASNQDGFKSEATWKIHLAPPTPSLQQSVPNQISGVMNSVKPHLALKRRKSSKLSLKEVLLPTTLLELCEQPASAPNQNSNSNASSPPADKISPLIAGGVACNLAGSVAVAAAGAGGDMVCYMEEPTAGNPNRKRAVELSVSDSSQKTMRMGDIICLDAHDESDNYSLPYVPETITTLTDAHKNAIRAIRKIRYFVARRKFQQARKPYDVRDVIEQYSQGHLNMMVRIKELQRRIDTTLGKPGSMLFGDRKRQTVVARVAVVEQNMQLMDRKLDKCMQLLNILVDRTTPQPVRRPKPSSKTTTSSSSSEDEDEEDSSRRAASGSTDT
nr:potassium voltage-gated channel subfamily KQT member 1-like [Lytechinus pictus]